MSRLLADPVLVESVHDQTIDLEPSRPVSPKRGARRRKAEAAILAGGQSRRLGGCDKARLPLGPTRVIDRLIATIRPLVDDLVVVTNAPGAHAGLGVRTIQDRLPGRGVLAGIDAALAATEAPYVLIVACDMPFLGSAFLRELLCAAHGTEMAVVRTPDGHYPVCASIARTCHQTVRRLLDAGHLPFRELLGSLQVRELRSDLIAKYDSDGALLLNVNTPFDYARALAICEPDWRASYPHDTV